MKKIITGKLLKLMFLSLVLLPMTSCDYLRKMERRATSINTYEKVALNFSKRNRELKAEISRLRFEIQTLKSENSFLSIKLEKKKKTGARKIASIGYKPPKNDLVRFDIYKWKADQVLAVAESEFKKKNFERSAQFFQAFIEEFPGHKMINDQLLFQAGVASFESKKHNDWSLMNLQRLVREYPVSKYYRGAKLWMALTKLRQGDRNEFFETVEEFRKKYRNTSEWKILSAHYEEILQKYKR